MLFERLDRMPVSERACAGEIEISGVHLFQRDVDRGSRREVAREVRDEPLRRKIDGGPRQARRSYDLVEPRLEWRQVNSGLAGVVDKQLRPG